MERAYAGGAPLLQVLCCSEDSAGSGGVADQARADLSSGVMLVLGGAGHGWLGAVKYRSEQRPASGLQCCAVPELKQKLAPGTVGLSAQWVYASRPSGLHTVR